MLEKLKEDVAVAKVMHPELAQEIQELYQLCLDEIEEGGSETHEVQLCYGAIDDLLDND